MIQNSTASESVIAEFCRRWQVRELSIFGSALRDDFGPHSDIDLLVDFAPEARVTLEALLAMRDELADIYGRPIDLVDRAGLRNPWRRHEILRTRQVLYAA